jgi:hypothetical protein
MINILQKFTMPKRESDMSAESDKKKSKVVTLEVKLDIIKRFDNGQNKHQHGARPQRV